MKSKLSLFLTFAAYIFSGCLQEPKEDSNQIRATQPMVDEANPIQITTSQKSSIYLRNALKEDLEKDLIHSLSRNYLLSETDLNNDGKMEIFLGLQGSYFCGSGGCTVMLLDSSGKLITRFTVTDFPILLSKDRTNDWTDLILTSRGKQHLMKFDGSKYPSNPSVEPEITVNESESNTPVLDSSKPGTDKASF